MGLTVVDVWFTLREKSCAIDSIQAGENCKDLRGVNEPSEFKKKDQQHQCLPRRILLKGSPGKKAVKLFRCVAFFSLSLDGEPSQWL